MKDENSNLVKVTVRMTSKQKEQLDRRAAKAGVPMAEYVRGLLTKKALAIEPPEELWAVMNELYSLHDMLLRIKKPFLSFFPDQSHLINVFLILLQTDSLPKQESSQSQIITHELFIAK